MRLSPLLLAACLCTPAEAAEAGSLQPQRIPPTDPDIAYGDLPDQALDLWRAEGEGPHPLVIFIHGGGFRKGSRKEGLPYALFRRCLAAGISCASLEYRLSGVAIYPAQMHDCARAVQVLRARAADWDLDPSRFIATGGSAGAGISLWLAFHDDLADPAAEDPIARQSTRLSGALPTNAQCSYDPRLIKTIIPGRAYQHPALKLLHGLPETYDWDSDPITPEIDVALRDCSPVTHLDAGDPPVWMLHFAKNVKDGNIHHNGFATYLATRMAEVGVPFEHYLDSDFADGEAIADAMVAFIQGCFRAQP